MQCGHVCFVIAILFCSVESVRRPSASSMKKIHGDGNSILESNDIVTKIAASADSLGRSLEYLIIAGVDKSKFLPVLKFIPQASAAFSAIGFALKIYLAVSGNDESPLMTQIKKGFDEINNKLDAITSDLEDNRRLITLSAQRAAYIDAENKILSAHQNVRKYIREVKQLKCNNKANCIKRQLLIAQGYLPRLNVEKEVDMILRGVTTNGVFGTSMLSLAKESSKCDINKIKYIASTFAGLASKGKIAIMLFEFLTHSSFDIVAFETEFARKLLSLERARNLVSKQCYDTIDRYIRSDVKYLSTKKYEQYDMKQANIFISEFLQKKYFWIRFYVVSFSPTSNIPSMNNSSKFLRFPAGNESDVVSFRPTFNIPSMNNSSEFLRIATGIDNDTYSKEQCMKMIPHLFAKKTVINDLTYIGKNKEVFSYVLIGDKREESDRVYKDSLKKFMDGRKYWTGYIDWSERNIHELFASYDAILLLLPCYEGEVSYETNTGTIKIVDAEKIESESKKSLLYISYHGGMRALALRQNEYTLECSLVCNFRGSCNFLPHSQGMYCICDDGFYGRDCKSSIGNKKLTNEINNLFKSTRLIIPTLSDLKSELEKTESLIRLKFESSNERITMLSGRMNRVTTSIVDEINRYQQWQGLVLQYSDVIQDLKYYENVFTEYEKADVDSNSFLQQERLSFATSLVNPDKLEKCLQMVNYLFVGRHDTPLINHKSLIFEEMDKNKADMCSDTYKLSLDHAYSLLVTLQMQGYMSYIRAFQLLGMKSSNLLKEYEVTLRSQNKFLDDHTCNIVIPHSKNLENCQGGYYAYSGMEVNVVCQDTFFLKGNQLLYHFAMGVACQQGTLTLPDTWFRPPLLDLLVLQLLRPDSSNLPCLYSTCHLENPLVLSRFCLKRCVQKQTKH